MVFDVFQEGLVRGAASMPFDPAKEYFYVEHPQEGWRVYLRACCFIHELQADDETCWDASRFLVVKRAGRSAGGKEWEPPKGQMEGKDGLRHPRTAIMDLLAENVKREVGEESRVHVLKDLHHTGLVLQNREKDYPLNTYFQYHVFHALVEPKEWMRASAELDWYRAHPKAFAKLRRDHREKDALSWFSPSDTKLMGRWSPQLVAMYLKEFT